MKSADKNIAVIYLARGADIESKESFRRFISSYIRNDGGIPHSLYVVLKGFADRKDLYDTQRLFDSVCHEFLLLEDNSFDIGAYIEAANRIDEEYVCMLNTASEPLCKDWLMKLYVNLTSSNIGLVGATGSYESNSFPDINFPSFPNLHLRSNAFMIRRKVFCGITEGLVIREKRDSLLFESGPESLFRRIQRTGQEILIVGRNGRGYSSPWWPDSETFRLGTQSNLLVADNQTRNYAAMSWQVKQEFVLRTWGKYLNEEMPGENAHGLRNVLPGFLRVKAATSKSQGH